MKSIIGAPLLIFSLQLFMTSCQTEPLPTPATVDCNLVGYAATIAPLITAKCSACHGSGSGDGVMTDYNSLKGWVDNGKFRKSVIDVRDMPQNDSYTTEELGEILCWLDSGAPNN